MIHVLQGVDFSRLVKIKYSGGINCQENEVKIINDLSTEDYKL